MSTTACYGVVRGRTVVFQEGSEPPADGTRVLVTPVPPEAGTAAAVLGAMDAEPHLDPSDVDALEAAIAEGRRPRTSSDLFGSEPDQTGAT